MTNIDTARTEITALRAAGHTEILVSLDSNGEARWGDVAALPASKMVAAMQEIGFGTEGMLTADEFDALHGINTADLPAIPVATITGTDGNTLTLELHPEINPDHGIRYTIRAVETDDDTETSGNWFGGETITEADRAAAEDSAVDALNMAWGTGWNLTSLN